MKRTKALRLVLLGGGVATMLASCGDDRARREACERAKAEMRPDALQLCQRSSGRSGSTSSFGRSYIGSGWTSGRTTSTTDSAASRSSSTSRSGFGSTASSSAGS